MIKEILYSIELSGYLFYVLANNFAEAEKIALNVIDNNKTYKESKIYHINRVGDVYRPKTKTITVEV